MMTIMEVPWNMVAPIYCGVKNYAAGGSMIIPSAAAASPCRSATGSGLREKSSPASD
jgi:hypothetical protein